MAIVGKAGTLVLQPADGKGDGIAVPCRDLHVVGLQVGLVALRAR